MMQSLKVAFFRRYYRFTNWQAWRAPNIHDEPGGLELPTERGPIRAHMFRGAEAATRPLVIYFHGGGWVIGDLQTHSAYCRALCEASGATVIAVDYRRAPEQAFPAAQDDCLAAAQALARQQGDFGPHQGIVLAGDSAGGHLSLTTALAADDELRSLLCGLVLTYPVVDHYTAPYPSYEDCATGQALTSSLMRWFWDCYLGDADPNAADTRRAFPIRSEHLADLPRSIVCTAGRDPLRDEGMAMVKAMTDAGVSVEHEHYGDSEHGFACGMGPSRDYQHWLERCATFIGSC